MIDHFPLYAAAIAARMSRNRPKTPEQNRASKRARRKVKATRKRQRAARRGNR